MEPRVVTEIGEELLVIAERLDEFVAGTDESAVKAPLDSLEAAAKEVGESWSGSWLGYQALVYYAGLKPQPSGCHFSIEWGIEERLAVEGTVGDWREFTKEAVVHEVYQRGGNPDLSASKASAKRGAALFDESKADVESSVATLLQGKRDVHLEGLLGDLKKLKIFTADDFVRSWRSAPTMTRDSRAATQGMWTPPHLSVLAEVLDLRTPGELCDQLASVVKKMGRHLGRRGRGADAPKVQSNPKKLLARASNRIFIAHGRSGVWRDLRDFFRDRLNLQWDEFNRVAVAGKSNVERLSEMLDGAAMAFVVMTGEDEQADGKVVARMNVVHEAGLFQGRLGFKRAIVLLEEGCDEFSNIAGLGQIRFPKGDIAAKFEEIRRVLEREGILESL